MAIENSRNAAIVIMDSMKDLGITPQESAEALGLAWCGTLNASYKIYETHVKETKTDELKGMTWEEFLNHSLDSLKLRSSMMRADLSEALHP